ncbi:MAG: hypothetical protein IPH31_04855 [Lewinellaceae bacterium]|nr:hypothetical protein [Lewinellaceae bacterium]
MIRKHLPKAALVAFHRLASCTRNTTLRVLQPAQMTLPEHITTVAIVDRSKPSNGWSNFLEGLFTGEEIGQDRRSRQTAVDGLTNALTRSAFSGEKHWNRNDWQQSRWPDAART